MITAQNLLAHEWIGLRVTIRESSDPGVRGVAGAVRNETRNTFIIETEERRVRVSKPNNVFVVTLPNRRDVTVEGARLMYRPEDRVRRGLRGW